MESYERVEALEAIWNQKGFVPGTIFPRRAPRGFRQMAVAIEVNSLRVQYVLQIGPKDGLKAEITVVDPFAGITADQLRFVAVLDYDECNLDVPALRQQVADGADPMYVCTAALELLAAQAADDASGFALGLREPLVVGSSISSVRHLRG